MKKLFRVRFFGSQSDNLKSKIQNRKLAGLLSIIVALTFAFGGVVAEAQQTGKIFRIGYLDPSNASSMAALLEAFRQELSKLGWIAGKNITIEYRFGDNKGPSHLPELAADLVRLKVDLIVVTDRPSAAAAKKATTTIPIVIANAGDPWAQVWLPVWRDREAMLPGSRLYRPS